MAPDDVAEGSAGSEGSAAPPDAPPAEPPVGPVAEVDDELPSDVPDPGEAPRAGLGGEERFVDGTPGRSSAEIERDEYRDAFLRVKADFENYKKRQAKEAMAQGERALVRMVEQLLPVLDACDAAIGHGAEGVEPIAGALRGTLEKDGLQRIDAAGDPFDPTLHEAVMREEGDDGEQVVAEVLRPGYLFNGTLVRAAMVKVKG